MAGLSSQRDFFLRGSLVLRICPLSNQVSRIPVTAKNLRSESSLFLFNGLLFLRASISSLLIKGLRLNKCAKLRYSKSFWIFLHCMKCDFERNWQLISIKFSCLSISLINYLKQMQKILQKLDLDFIVCTSSAVYCLKCWSSRYFIWLSIAINIYNFWQNQ